MTNLVRVLALVALLVACLTPAWADGPRLERALKNAEEQIERNNFQQAERYLETARKELDGVPAEERDAYAAKIKAVFERGAAAKRAYDREQFLKSLSRQFDSVRRVIEDGKRSKGDRSCPKNIERYVDRVREILATEEAKVLTAEDRAEIESTIKSLQAEAVAIKITAHLNYADEYVGRAEQSSGGRGSWNIEQQLELAADELKQCPASDPRVVKMRERIRQTVEAYNTMRAKAQRDAVVVPALNYWAKLEETYGEGSAGWKQEAAEFETFLNAYGMGLEKTIDRCQTLERMLEYRYYQEALANYGDDPEVQALATKVDAAYAEVSSRLCSMAKTLVEGSLEHGDQDRPKQITHLDTLVEKLEAHGQAGADYEATFELAQNRLLDLQDGEALDQAQTQGM